MQTTQITTNIFIQQFNIEIQKGAYLMRKIILLLGLVGFVSACDPQDTYQECRDAGQNQHYCVVHATGHMFIHPSWE